MAGKEGTKVANAFVTIIPTMEGSREKIGAALFSAGTSAGDKAGRAAGKSMTEGLSTAKLAIGTAVGNIITSAATKVASGVKDIFKNSFDNYANYEQLIGGVDTLFKASSDIVQKNAENAFKTAGLSANEYMETVTSFSASLISSVGGDTERAAALADKALVDMSDNANKMGTSMESLQFAYQGFAKQNYTMLSRLAA